jgi:multidrug efflux pump subunit AcrA (membrane-fusion protein)
LHWQWFVGLAVVGGVAAGAGLTRDRWLPLLESATPSSAGDDAHEGHAHVEDPHDHAHAGHSAATSLELDDKAGKNIGLKVGVVKPRDYTRTVSVPAMVVERPGRSQVEITAPLTGIVTRVYPLSGEAMLPGEPLFELRLTHEDLVTAQRDFLRSVEELDVVQREIKRLESVGEGVIAGRRVIEQKYEQQKLQAALHAQRQGLLLHGLDDEQINRILETRQLQQTLIVHAPSIEHDEGDPSGEHLFHVQKIVVKRGEHVTAGDTLGVLSDHCLLYVEGQAFEDDADQLVAATRDGTKIRVSPLADQNGDQSPLALSVMYVADHVDQQSRALRFYLSLPNQLVHDRKGPDGRFVAWRYRPGQRMEVRVPIGQAWENQIVLPADAVVQEGAETFVFEQNGKHFDRVAVHVLIRDKDAVVVENDGSLVGSSLAMSGAYQMHLAIKNKSGGAIDPHAGHNH